MQAVKAYSNDGIFVPFQPVSVPNGSHAIITILDFPLSETSNDSPIVGVKTEERQARLAWLDRLKTALADSDDESLPDFPPQGLMRDPLW